jgi:hypothetical protein
MWAGKLRRYGRGFRYEDGQIWSRGDGHGVSMLFVGFCRRSGQWLAEDVTTYAPALSRRLTGIDDFKETLNIQSPRGLRHPGA